MKRWERFDVRAIAPQHWKNGAGLTREIAFAGADAASFDWRLSVAEVEHDAPFSAFPGVDRCIVLLSGGGMRLRSPDGAIDHALTEPLAPFRFSGDVALAATLAGGPSRDFNVMTRRGVFRGEVQCTHAATNIDGADAAFLLGVAGAWDVAGDPSLTVQPMHGLLWREPVAPLRIVPRSESASLLVVRLCHDRQP